MEKNRKYIKSKQLTGVVLAKWRAAACYNLAQFAMHSKKIILVQLLINTNNFKANFVIPCWSGSTPMNDVNGEMTFVLVEIDTICSLTFSFSPIPSASSDSVCRSFCSSSRDECLSTSSRIWAFAARRWMPRPSPAALRTSRWESIECTSRPILKVRVSFPVSLAGSPAEINIS